eukprot:11221429-Lingulodinium_polyedra.AAC.1
MRHLHSLRWAARPAGSNASNRTRQRKDIGLHSIDHRRRGRRAERGAAVALLRPEAGRLWACRR